MGTYKKIFMFMLMASLTIGASIAFADAPAIAANPDALPLLTQISAVLSQAASGPMAMLILFVAEGVAKLWPTANPQGFFLSADKVLKKAGVILSQIGDICIKLDEIVAVALPHNTIPKA